MFLLLWNTLKALRINELFSSLLKKKELRSCSQKKNEELMSYLRYKSN